MSVEVQAPEPALWLDRYGDELFRFALRRVSERTSAEELVQETLLSALDALATFRGQASERSWLFLILKRKIIDHYRRQARSPLVPLASFSPAEGDEAPFFTPEDGHWRPEQYPQAWTVAADELEQQDLRLILHGCQQQLSVQHRAVFVLRFVDEHTAEEVCQELGISAANYWVIIHRVKLTLRRCLETHWFGAKLAR